MTFRPILAAPVKGRFDKLRFPLIATPKLDGIRCVIHNGIPYSRSMIPIPNRYTCSMLRDWCHVPLDGELMLRGKDTFQSQTSAFMSGGGEPDFVYWVFDHVGPQRYVDRVLRLKEWCEGYAPEFIRFVPTHVLRSLGDLHAYEQKALKLGFEGVCLRKPSARYKNNRSTFNEHHLLKLTWLETSEAEIIGFQESEANWNEPEISPVGLTKRSTARSGKVPKGTLGAFVVKDPKFELPFNIGTGDGLTQALRKAYWEDQNTLLGQLVKYRYKPIGSTKDRPRHPVWLGIRDRRDM
jgi:DNA ligase-1